jgi:hypothetical protein
MSYLMVDNSTRRLERLTCAPHEPDHSDVVEFARRRLKFHPDEKQAEVLRSTSTRGILNCSRQWGKTSVIAALAAHCAYTQPGSDVIVASPSLRQSGEWMRRVKFLLRNAGVRTKKDEDHKISAVLPNGSRLIGLPHVPETTRGFSAVAMLVIEEAAYVSDEMLHALTPTLATTNGKLWLVSTPNGKSGFFYDTWQAGGEDWHRVRVIATDCTRISSAFLQMQLADMGRDIFGREFLCEFLGSGANAFARELVDAALDDSVEPLDRQSLLTPPHFLSTRAGQMLYVSVDLGKIADYSTIAITESSGDEFHVRFLERIPLGTPYPRVVEIIRDVVRSPLLSGRCTLVVDASGVGEAVVDMLRRADLGCGLTPVRITGGHGNSRGGGYNYVAKHNLMTSLLVVVEQGHLKFARRMNEAGSLVKELLSIRVHENGSMSADRPAHDDLVMAVALALWKSGKGFNDRGSGGFLP